MTDDTRPTQAESAVRCSLIVLNFEGILVVKDCVDSLLATKRANDEIIVVENGSSDGSRELLLQYGDRVRLVLLPENTFIFGLNAGLEVASGEYVAFLNNDMTVERSFVDNCVSAIEAGGDDVFAACPRILQGDGHDQGSRTAGYWSRGLLFYRPLLHVDAGTDCFFAVGGQSLFRRRMLQEIGSIDPLLWPMYHEDIELSYRAWKRGWRVVYAPDAVARHLGSHASKRVFSPGQLRAIIRQNEYLIIWKNITDPRLLAAHFAFLPGRLGVALIKRDWPTLRGFATAMRRGPAVWAARRTSKRHHRLTDAQVLRRISSIW